MFTAAICRLRGHRALCEQEATLHPDGTGSLDHRHTCLRCGVVLIFQTEPLPDALDDELRGIVVVDQTITLMMDPSYAHRSDYVQ
jgi:hypothetical protein